jgi:hypothetical protein
MSLISKMNHEIAEIWRHKSASMPAIFVPCQNF